MKRLDWWASFVVETTFAVVAASVLFIYDVPFWAALLVVFCVITSVKIRDNRNRI